MLGEFMEVNLLYLPIIFFSLSLQYVELVLLVPMLSPQIILDVWWMGSSSSV